VTNKFRGHASSWWHQVKKSRKQADKSPIKSWTKLKQKLCATFLPRNYDHTMYNCLRNSRLKGRLVDDYTENCGGFQVKDFVNKPIYDVVGDDVSSTKRTYDGDPKIGVKDDGFNDVKNDGFDDVVSNAENIDDYFNTQDVDDNDKAVANKIDDVNVFVAVVEDCDSHDDPSQDEGASFDVTKVDDLVDNVNPLDVFSNVFSPVDDGCEEDVYNTDFIGNQVVEYRRLSSIQYEVVITNHDKEVEVSYLDNGNHIYSIFSCKRSLQYQ